MGKLAHALIDLTGGVSEIIRITEKYKVPRNFFNDLMKNEQMNSLLTGSIKVSVVLSKTQMRID